MSFLYETYDENIYKIPFDQHNRFLDFIKKINDFKKLIKCFEEDEKQDNILERMLLKIEVKFYLEFYEFIDHEFEYF